MLAHRDKSGKFKTLQMADPTGVYVNLYINRDENPHQSSTRMLTKRCARIIKEKLPKLDSQLFAKQRDCKICLGWKTLVSFSAAPVVSTPVIKWNLNLAASHEIDPVPLQQLFYDSCLRRTDDDDLQLV